VKNLKISETMRKEIYSNHETHGVWEPSTGTIVIKRTQLSSLTNYAGTLLHEIIHAQSGFGDVSRDFEMKLTELLGIICAIALERPKKPSLFKRFFN
jgi:hypothetical protein